jgi:hypothetical protein
MDVVVSNGVADTDVLLTDDPDHDLDDVAHVILPIARFKTRSGRVNSTR